MWLLDVNTPKKLGRLLGKHGIEAHSADDRGWGGLANGALVESGESSRLRVHPYARSPVWRIRRSRIEAIP